jgi:hypothetical protein
MVIRKSDGKSYHGAVTLIATNFMLISRLACLFFNPEGGGDEFLQNVRRLSANYIALYSRNQNSS